MLLFSSQLLLRYLAHLLYNFSPCAICLLFSRSNATLGGWKRAALQSSIALARLLRHEAPPLLPAFAG